MTFFISFDNFLHVILMPETRLSLSNPMFPFQSVYAELVTSSYLFFFHCYPGISVSRGVDTSRVNISSQNTVTYPDEDNHYAFEGYSLNISCSFPVEEESGSHYIDMTGSFFGNDSQTFVSQFIESIIIIVIIIIIGFSLIRIFRVLFVKMKPVLAIMRFRNLGR